MRGCSLNRGLLSASLVRELDPRSALELARHLAECSSCRTVRSRQEMVDRQLDGLLEIEVPSTFTGSVMRRVREAAPSIRKVGACVVFAVIAAAATLGARVPRGGGGLLPDIRIEWGESFSAMVLEFGRAVVFLLMETFTLHRGGSFGSAHPAATGVGLAAPLFMLACLAALVTAVVVASSPLLRAQVSPPSGQKLTR
jgi:Putative zinc-finger